MDVKNIVLLVVFILGIVLIQYVQAQSVDSIINKYIEARGGKDKLNAIRSICMEGFRQMMDITIPVKITIVQDQLYRNDFEFGGNSGYTIVTPTQGWMFIPMRSQTAESISTERLKIMQAQLDIAGSLVDYAAKGNKAELQGKETIDGKEAYKIKLTTNSGKEITFYIDRNTNLLIQSREMAAPIDGNGQLMEIITNYSDYKSFDEVMFPQTISNPGTGPQAGSMTFNKIELNKKIEVNQYIPSN